MESAVILEAKLFALYWPGPAGSYTNQKYLKHLEIVTVDPYWLIFSVIQSSGGLLISLPGSMAASLVEKLKEKGIPQQILLERLLKKPGTIEVG